MKNNQCVMCGKPLKNGIIVEGIIICRKCESRIIKENSDTDFYKFYKNRIKKYIIPFLAYRKA